MLIGGELVTPFTPRWKVNKLRRSVGATGGRPTVGATGIRPHQPVYYGRDTGCKLHPRCLECPRPKCVEDREVGATAGRPDLSTKEDKL